MQNLVSLYDSCTYRDSGSYHEGYVANISSNGLIIHHNEDGKTRAKKVKWCNVISVEKPELRYVIQGDFRTRISYF